MRPGRLIIAIAPPFFILGLCVGLVVPLVMPSKTVGAKVDEVVQLVRDQYHTDVDDEKLIEGAMGGIAKALDPHSQYFTRDAWEQFNNMQLRGQFFGVGILLGLDPDSGYLKVETPLQDSPALRGGIQTGDRITAVDGHSIQWMQMRDVIKLIKGPEGTPVTLTILRKDEDPFDVPLKRAKIKVAALHKHLIRRDGKPDVAYLRLVGFSEGLAGEVAEAIRGYRAPALIIDLRNNSGGLLDECVKICSLFVGEQKITTTRSRQVEKVRNGVRDRMPELEGVPVIVLADGNSASASEILAGVLQYYKVAEVVGQRTYGKGSVQEAHQLRDGSRFKLTVALYYLPSGRSVHRDSHTSDSKDYGIPPDHPVAMTEEQSTALGEWWNDLQKLNTPPPMLPGGAGDPQLAKALELLDARLGD